MKKLPIPVYYLLALAVLSLTFLASLTVSGQTYSKTNAPEIPVVKTNAANHKTTAAAQPGKANFYTWSNGWQPDIRMEYTYDLHGNMLKSVMIDGLTNDTIQKDFYTYDTQNNLTERLVKVHTNGQWKLDFGQRHTYTYNGSFNILQDITEEYFNGNWENKAKLNYVFNTAGLQTEETVSLWQNGGWQYNVKRLSYYQNGLLSGYVVQNYANSAWVNFGNFYNYTWDASAGKVLGYTSQEWVNNAWADKLRLSFIYNQTGGYTMVNEENINGVWENTLMRISLENSATNMYGFQVFDWQISAWVKVAHQEAQHFHDVNNNLTEVIETRWNAATNQMDNELRIIFSDFMQVNAIHKNRPAIEVTIYPNPAVAILTVQLENNTATEAKITDLTGREVLSETLNTQENRIDISGLAKGAYILKLQNKNGASVSWIVKQ